MPIRLVRTFALGACLIAGVVGVQARGALAAVLIQLETSSTAIEPGELFEVRVDVPVEGDGFNGYDAVLRFDATRLEVILPSPASTGEGSLFTEACALRFLDLSQDGDSSRVRVSHVVLCAGLSLTGPGTLYQLQFRARSTEGIAFVELTAETQAYDAGFLVPTELGAPLSIQVGEVTATPTAPNASGFRAVPNPFNPSTEFRFDLATASVVALEVYDTGGRRVKTLVAGHLTAGAHRVRWDGRDQAQRLVASGTYVASLQTPSGRQRTRLTLIR